MCSPRSTASNRFHSYIHRYILSTGSLLWLYETPPAGRSTPEDLGGNSQRPNSKAEEPSASGAGGDQPRQEQQEQRVLA